MGGCCEKMQALKAAAMEDGEFTFEDVVDAIKELLQDAIEWAVHKASKAGGFLNNSAIRIPWPEQLSGIKRKLKKIGMGKKIKNFVARVNAAAERASTKALDIIVDAIMSLSLDRVDDILHGGATAATEFLRETCYDPLAEVFHPIIDRFLEKEKVTSVWDDLIDAYNAIPFVSDIDFELDWYVVHKALDGLFYLLAEREEVFRDSPELAHSAKAIAMLNNIDDLFFDSSSDDYDDSDDDESSSVRSSYDDDSSYSSSSS